jgi:hypothetical protein
MGVEQRVEELHDHIPKLPREIFEERETGAEPGIVGLLRITSGEEEIRGSSESPGKLRESLEARLIPSAFKLADLTIFRIRPRSKLALAPAFCTAEAGETVSERFRW